VRCKERGSAILILQIRFVEAKEWCPLRKMASAFLGRLREWLSEFERPIEEEAR
jgi:hypothetical protein